MATEKKVSLSASLEDYLEVIYNLTGETDTARSKDIAEALNVAKPSVTGALRILKEKELVNYKPYGYVTLTKEGKKAAYSVNRKHNIIKAFFVNVLGIDVDTAQQSACKAEHAFGPEVISRLLCFIEFVTKENKNGYDPTKEFKCFYSKKR